MGLRLKMIINLDEWLKIYEKIAKDLNLSYEEDTRATDILSVLIRNKSLSYEVIGEKINDKYVIICGAGPSIDEDLESLKKIKSKKVVFVTCDGATTAFLNILGRSPDIIVTDLDGDVKDQVACIKEGGSLGIVHAHGDNKEQIAIYVPKLPKLIGTTQVRPRENVYNFGGFTDGDRAAFICASFSPKAIILAGMDLGDEIGKYSKVILFERSRKLMKLRIAKELLELLSQKIKEKNKKIKLYNFTKGGVEINGFKRIKIKELVNIIFKK